MKHWKILSLVCFLLFMAADVQAKKYYYNKWKKKGDKMALLYRPNNEGKWQQVTDFIFDANYSRSYHSWDKKDPDFIDHSQLSIVEVKTSEGCGFIDCKGRVVIPCQYKTYDFRNIKDEIINSHYGYFIYGTMSNGKKHLYHVSENGAIYKSKYSHTVKRLDGEYDNIFFDESERGRYSLTAVKKPGITVVIDGKIGKVRWNTTKNQFDRLLLCEYTETSIDSLLEINLRGGDTKWSRRKNDTSWVLLEKDGKYGVFLGDGFLIPARYDSASFIAPAWTGFTGKKAKSVMKVESYENNGTFTHYTILQRDGMRCVLDENEREIFTHPLPKGKEMPCDFVLDGLGNVYYVSGDGEKWFYRQLEDSVQVNCRGDLTMVRPFVVMPKRKNDYWLMKNGAGYVGLYNSKTDQMILPAQYQSIDLPDQLNDVFTVTDTLGVTRRAFITHDGAAVVQFNSVKDLLKMSKVVKKVGKYQILKYKDAYGVYNTSSNAATALNLTTVKPLSEVKADVNPAFKNVLLTTRGTKKGVIASDYFFNTMYDEVVLTDSAVAVVYKDWYSIYEMSGGARFNTKPEALTRYIQYLKINSNGKEVVDDNILQTTLYHGDSKKLARDIKTLSFLMRSDMITTHYELALAGWNVKQGNYNTAISQYTAIKGKLGDGAAQIDVLIEKLRDLQAQKDEKERWEAEQREMERLMAEEQRKQEEYEQQRRYIEQQRAAEARRQQKLQAWADVAAAAATMAQGINNAVQKRYNPQYRQPQVSTNRNYNAHYNQQVTNVNRAELNDAKRYYNDWVERAKSSMTRYIEADAKLKVPGISQITRTNAHQSRQREWQYLQNCLKWMRSYRNRAAQLGGNIPISQTELKVEALLN